MGAWLGVSQASCQGLLLLVELWGVGVGRAETHPHLAQGLLSAGSACPLLCTRVHSSLCEPSAACQAWNPASSVWIVNQGEQERPFVILRRSSHLMSGASNLLVLQDRGPPPS